MPVTAFAAAEAACPPTISGEFAGELKLDHREPGLVLPWRLVLAAMSDGLQSYEGVIEAAGTQLHVAGRLSMAGGEGDWCLKDGALDAGVWLALLGAGTAFEGMSAQGVIRLEGDGAVHRRGIAGRVRCSWHDGVLVHPAEGWKLEGISFSGEFAIDGVSRRVSSTEPFELRIARITHPRFGARNLVLKGLLTPQPSLQVVSAQLEIAGGELFVDPADVPLVPPSLDLNLRFQRVGLQDVVQLVPSAGLADARGRIDGRVRVRWDNELGLRYGVGQLGLCHDEPAVVRLSPSIGLLTGRLDPYIDLSVYVGKLLGRLFRPENPAFKDLQQVELGQSELQVSSLQVNLTPEGDDQGRSATVRFVAQPVEKGSTVRQVTFDVNVVGPLNHVLQIWREKEFTVDAY